MKVLNFDQFMQEKNHEMIKVTVLGKEYEIKAEIPAIVPVMMARAENANDNQLATKMVMRAADAMFGSSSVDDMCNNGLTANNLADLVQRVFETIQNGNADEEEGQELSDEDSRKPVDKGTGNGKK